MDLNNGPIGRTLMSSHKDERWGPTPTGRGKEASKSWTGKKVPTNRLGHPTEDGYVVSPICKMCHTPRPQ